MSGGVIGDAYLHRSTVLDLMQRKESMHRSKDQAISGTKYTKARELKEQLVMVKNIQHDLATQSSYMQNNRSTVKFRVGEEERVIRLLQEEAEKFKTSLVSFSDGTTKDPAAFLNGLKEHMKVIQRVGNTRVGESYIFSGTITNIEPFNLSKIPDGLDPNSGETTDYYEGNSQSIFLAVSKDDNMECKLKGNHPAFERFIRALKIATDPSIKSGDDRIKKAQDLADEALTEFSDLISQIGSRDATLDRLITSQEDSVNYLQNAYDEIVAADEVEFVSKFMQDQNILSTAYSMLSHLGQMSLAEHWKG
jgi:flagellin-like hook-associated protein FlgL